MFHGPIFQGIEKIYTLNKTTITGLINGSLPAKCLNITDESKFEFDPIAFDSAMQLAGIWAKQFLNLTVLPAGFKKLTHFSDFNESQYYVKILINPETEFLELSCNLVIYNLKGELVLYVEELKGIGSRSLDRLSVSNANAK